MPVPEELKKELIEEFEKQGNSAAHMRGAPRIGAVLFRYGAESVLFGIHDLRGHRFTGW